MIVKPKFRGKGYGKELLKFAISLGGRKLISRKDNKRANKLYQKFGFKPVKKENNLIYWEFCGSF